MSATREQLQSAMTSVNAHNRPARTLYQTIKPHFPKNGPSPFRPVLADADTMELSQDIAAEQSAIREQQTQHAREQRQIAKLRRQWGVTSDPAALSDARLKLAMELQRELINDANPTPKP